jgi:hypothetical protein
MLVFYNNETNESEHRPKLHTDGNSETGSQISAPNFGHTATESNISLYLEKLNSVAWVRERIIPTERPPFVGEASANFYR